MFIKIILVHLFLFNCAHGLSKHPILIIVSYDAFGPQYFKTQVLPNMERIKKMGTYADYLINVFPTKTFPNHHSIATGLYAEVHGIVANMIFNKTSKEFYSINYDMFHYDDSIVPIWRWNEDQGQDRYSGSMMWPGGDYSYQGKNITYSKTWEWGYDMFKRVDEVISWILDPKKPANLVMLYIEEPDSHAHVYGTNSEEVRAILKTLDKVTKYLEDQLAKHKLTEKVNVIHLSDHGMVNVKPPNFIKISQHLPYGSYYMGGKSPELQIFPKEGYEDEIYESLSNASVENGHFQVYKKEDFLDRWHYKNNPRSPPIMVIADVGYALEDMFATSEEYAQKYNFTVTDNSEFGVHGYDYEVAEMHPYFMARGPRIKRAHKVAPFRTVDLYDLFTEILGLPHRANNGTPGNVKDVLIDAKSNVGTIIVITVGGILITLSMISVFAGVVLFLIKRQQNITTTAALNKRFPQTFQHNIIEARHLLEPEDA